MLSSPMTDTELLDFVQRHQVWLTHSRDDEGTPREWRCQLKFGVMSADGKTAREAIAALAAMVARND